MKFMSMLYCSMVGAFGFLALSLTLPTAGHADVFDFTSEHCSTCGTGPFGTVTVTQNGANVDITVDLANGINWSNSGFGSKLFKFNAAGVALEDVIVNQTFLLDILSAEIGVFDDGTGRFAFEIDCLTCRNENLGINNEIRVHVANATVDEVTLPNSFGNLFFARIFSSETSNSGTVDVSVQCLLGLCPPVDDVPGPIASAPGPIAGAGLPGLLAMFGMGGLYWRRRKKTA